MSPAPAEAGAGDKLCIGVLHGNTRIGQWMKICGSPRKRGARAPGDKGFTLIEILVATMVLAIALTMVMQLFSGGLRSARLSRDVTQAVFHAREKMDEILLSEDVSDQGGQGTFEDGYRWQAEVQIAQDEEESEEVLPVETYQVSVKVSWPVGEREKTFEVTTLKLQTRVEG